MNSLRVIVDRDKRVYVKSHVSRWIRSRDLLVCRPALSRDAMSDSERGSLYLYIDYDSSSLCFLEGISLLFSHLEDETLLVMLFGSHDDSQPVT